MDKGQTFTLESLLNNWNVDFPENTLKPDDLKKPHALMKALFLIFDRLGIDKDYVLAPPLDEDSNESVAYYWDLIPVINMTRVVNHLISIMSVSQISIIHFLQPSVMSSRSIILLLFNLMVFNESRIIEIAPYEEELFAKTEHVKTLESNKNQLIMMLNKQAEEKGERAERLKKLIPDVKQFEEELKQEKEIHNEEKQELEPILKENHQAEVLIEQKKSQRDAMMAEVARKKALRVYDADDIKAQAEQAAQNVQEAEEKLNTLKSTLMQKENSLKNLQTVKPSLDTGNNLLHEIMKQIDCLKDLESGDLDSDSKEGELDVRNTELSELQVQISELEAARAELADKRHESEAKRQNEKSQAMSALREAEEKDKKCRVRCKQATQRTDEIKQLTLQYEARKNAGMEELAGMKSSFHNTCKAVEVLLLNKVEETRKRVEDKLLSRKL